MLVISNSTRGLSERYTAIIACAAAFTAASVITLGMRIASKMIMRVPFTSEDYTISLATAIYLVIEGLLIKGVTVGRHSTISHDAPATILAKMVYIYSIFYFAAMALSIASILLTFRRIFVKPFMRRATTALLVITFCWWIPCMVIETGYFIVVPSTINGQPNKTMPFHLHYLVWWLVMGVIEQVILIVAVFLPIREVYALQLNFHKRLSIMLAFAISYVCVGTGIARLSTIYHPKRPGFDLGLGDIWISTHLGTALMSANLPVCWPVVSHTGRALIGIFVKSSRGQQVRSPETADREAWQRPAIRGVNPEGHGDSDIGTTFEMPTVRAATKAGNINHETKAQELDAISPAGSESDGSAISDGRQQMARWDGGAQTRLRPLEVRPPSWRLSLGGSLFAGSKSSRG